VNESSNTMNDVPLIPTALPIDDLTEEEIAAAREASQRAVEELRERNRRKAEILAIWSPALRDLEAADADGLSSMAECLMAAAKAFGWNEEEDNKLARLAVCLINDLELAVTVERHRNSPDRVRVSGYLLSPFAE
jgi:hypothetical protein